MITGVEAVKKAIAARKKPGRRLIVAIAGAPGAGKSTLADALCKELNQGDASCAAVLPMDGFHLDNAILTASGSLGKKGAPETFDADGFASILNRLRPGDRDVIVPVFDRVLDVARAGGRLIHAATEIIIVEGNYLLLDRPEWAQSACHYDLSVFIDVPRDVLKSRLIQRWLDHGLDLDAAASRAGGNDIRNAELVVRTSLSADIRLKGTDLSACPEKETLEC